MAYGTVYDGGFTRSMSRRPSMGYAVSAPAGYPGASYADPGIHGDAYSQYPYNSNAVVPLSRRLTGPMYSDDMEYGDSPYYDEPPLPHTYSRPATPHTQYANPAIGYNGPTSVVTIPPPRHRRSSTVSFVTPAPVVQDSYYASRGHRPGGSQRIKFKRKGAFTAGIGLDEAQAHGMRLSNNDAYTMHDLHADAKRTILLKIKWVGYSSLTYEIPLDSFAGRVSLSTLARRISRACVHYLQANVVPIPWNRVQLHHLEEISYGVWQPMLSAR